MINNNIINDLLIANSMVTFNNKIVPIDRPNVSAPLECFRS